MFSSYGCRQGANLIGVEEQDEQLSFSLMEMLIDGLREECDSLAAELSAIETGVASPCEKGPNGEQIDISQPWAKHLRAILAAKRSVLAELQKRPKRDLR